MHVGIAIQFPEEHKGFPDLEEQSAFVVQSTHIFEVHFDLSSLSQ